MRHVSICMAALTAALMSAAPAQAGCFRNSGCETTSPVPFAASVYASASRPVVVAPPPCATQRRGLLGHLFPDVVWPGTCQARLASQYAPHQMPSSAPNDDDDDEDSSDPPSHQAVHDDDDLTVAPPPAPRRNAGGRQRHHRSADSRYVVQADAVVRFSRHRMDITITRKSPGRR